jgi:hypothetical protein
MFGVEGKDEIVVWRMPDGTLSRVCLSFDLSDPNLDFIRSSIFIANSLKCVFLSIQSRRIFSPHIAQFVAHAENCRAARFIPSERPLALILG